MKIIDLLVKIANGEKIPKTIRFGCREYVYKKDEMGFLSYYDVYNNCLFKNYTLDDARLNDEVEIIEEDKKIGILPMIDETDDIILSINQTRRKVNEIIDKLNKELIKNDRERC